MAGSIKTKLEIGNLKNVTTYQAAALQTAANRVLRLHCNKILGPYGITKTQWLIIGKAMDAGKNGVSLKELCETLDMSSPAVSRIVALLEKKRMLTTKRTGNQKFISLHSNFAPDCPEIERILRTALQQSIYAAVTPLEFRIYLKVLHQLTHLQAS